MIVILNFPIPVQIQFAFLTLGQLGLCVVVKRNMTFCIKSPPIMSIVWIYDLNTT